MSMGKLGRRKKNFWKDCERTSIYIKKIYNYIDRKKKGAYDIFKV